jgi:hypothetical protein
MNRAQGAKDAASLGYASASLCCKNLASMLTVITTSNYPVRFDNIAF